MATNDYPLLPASCPDCGAPAKVGGIRNLGSTSGPMPHAYVRCTRRHWFIMPLADIPNLAPVPASREAETAPALSRAGVA